MLVSTAFSGDQGLLFFLRTAFLMKIFDLCMLFLPEVTQPSSGF